MNHTDPTAAAIRAAAFRDAEEICDEAGAVFTSKALSGEADGAYSLMERFRRKAEEAEQASAVVAPPTDRAELRKAAAEALFEHWDVHANDADLADDFDCCADAVLAVLPEPTNRAAVLRDAIARVRRIPVQCTGLTGPVWFGQGWKDAIGEFEEIAERLADEDQRRLAVEHGAGTQQPASTAPLAAGLPLVKGNCPRCHSASLFLGSGGYVTCARLDCPEPDAATTVLEQPAPVAQQPAAEAPHTGGNADDCPACVADDLDKLGYPWECPGEQQAAAADDEETRS